MGADAVQQAVQRQLGIGEHETTDDGEYSFVTEECLAACDHGPCMLINEKMHRNVRAADVPRLLADANNATLSIPRSTLFDAPTATDAADELETTSDVREMKES